MADKLPAGFLIPFPTPAMHQRKISITFILNEVVLRAHSLSLSLSFVTATK
jgi:hypothetical protein